MEISNLCNYCDAECCKRFTNGLILRGDDISHLEELQAVEDFDCYRLPQINGECIHLGFNNKCAIQHIKPTECREFLCTPAEAFNAGTPLSTCLILLEEQGCSICGKETSKRKTFAIGDGQRACREHEGVAEKGKQRKEQERKRLLNQKETEKRKSREVHRRRETLISTAPMCWICRKEGVNARDFYMQRLIDSEKHKEIHGVTNPFTDPDHPLTTRRTDTPVIFVVTKEQAGENKWRRLRSRAARDNGDMAEMIGFISVCADCCAVVQFNPLPEVSINTLEKMMSVVEAIRPAITDEAMRQMGRDN